MAVKTKFHIGDRVLVTGVQDRLTEAIGKEGTVEWVCPDYEGRPDTVVVHFDDRFSDRLHSGGFCDTDHCCWNIADDKLALAPPLLNADAIDDLL